MRQRVGRRDLRLVYKPASLAALTPGEWLARIRKLREPVKSRVASIVWMDFFSARLARDRWPHLDRYLDKPYVKVDRNLIAAGLVAVGYDAGRAVRRVASKEYEVSNRPGAPLYDRDSQAVCGVALRAAGADEVLPYPSVKHEAIGTAAA